MVDPEIGANLLIVEYERLKDEQKTRIGFRDNLIYATLASMAGVIAAVLSPQGHTSLLLLLPPVSTVLGWTYLVNDEKVSAIGRYIRENLGPGLESIAGVTPFGWESAHRSDRGRRSRKVLQLLVDLGTFCIPATSAVVVYWINGPRQWTLVAVSLVELAVVVALAVMVVRYADLAVGVSGEARRETTPDSTTR